MNYRNDDVTPDDTDARPIEYRCTGCDKFYTKDLVGLKVGNKVQAIKSCHHVPQELVGQIGTIVEVDQHGFEVHFAECTHEIATWKFLKSTHELKVVEG